MNVAERSAQLRERLRRAGATCTEVAMFAGGALVYAYDRCSGRQWTGPSGVFHPVLDDLPEHIDVWSVIA